MSVSIVFLDRETLPARIQLRAPQFAHQWRDYPATTAGLVVPRLQEADIAIVNKVRIGEAELAALPRLRLVAVAATGSDNVDLEACCRHGVAVCNVQGYAVHAVVEHTLALMLALARNLPAYQSALRAGAWQQSPHFCYFGPGLHDLAGKKLGLIGSGVLGRNMARLGQALGMQVRFAARRHGTVDHAPLHSPGEVVEHLPRLPFDELVRDSDAISLHCPLNDETRNMFGAREFELMKPGALFINTARGGLVDEEALLQALQSGHLAGAASDVARREPPQAGDPLLRALALPNFILTPHVAWASDEAMQALAEQVITNLEAFQHGDSLRRLV
jgi:glycerate dehydrogenase